MPPGQYTVVLTVDGQSYQQPLEVRKDPNTPGTLADIRAQTNLLLALQKDHAETGDVLSTVEHVRVQMQALATQLANDASAAAVRAATDSLEQQFIALEQRIVDLRMTGQGQDEVRYPVKLAGQIGWLAGGVDASDFAPTTQAVEVQIILAKQTQENRATLEKLVNDGLAKLNVQLRARGLKPIEARPVTTASATAEGEPQRTQRWN
jgi:hypothetical protein